MRARTAAAASVIWALGAWLRLHNLSMMEFKSDERVSLELAIQFISDHPWSSPQPWPSHGMISSNGIGNAPLFTWIVAPLWAFTHDPVGVTALIAWINAVCLVPLWLWARRHMDEDRALLVLAIAAVSPFAVLYSRKIWPVDLLLPSLITVLWSVDWWRSGRFWHAVALAGVGVLLITQLHQSGVITAPLLMMAFGIQWIRDVRNGLMRRPGRPTIANLAAVVVVVAANLFFWWTYLPYLRSMPAEVVARRPLAESFAPQLLYNVVSEIIPRHVSSPFFVERLLFRSDPLRAAIFYASAALGAPLAAYGIWRWLRAPFTLPVLGVWWWMVAAVFAAARIPSHDYYVLALMPLPMVLAAGAFDGALPSTWRRVLLYWRWTYVVALLALTIVAGTWLIRRGGSIGDYGVAFAIQQQQARELLVRAKADPIEPAMVIDASATDVAGSECHKISFELVWIARWIDPTSTSGFRQFQMCDGWRADDRAPGYYWEIRHR